MHWIKAHLDLKVKRWELCAFNNLCRDKYARLGLAWRFEDADLLEENHIQRLVSVARNSGVDPDIVHWSGSSKLEASETITESERTGLKIVA